MACSLNAEAVRTIVLKVLRHYADPVTDDSILLQLQISVTAWQSKIFPDIKGKLRAAGCCLASMKAGDLPSKPRTVTNLIALLKADLVPCVAVIAVAKRKVKVKKKKKKRTTKSRKRVSR